MHRTSHVSIESLRQWSWQSIVTLANHHQVTTNQLETTHHQQGCPGVRADDEDRHPDIPQVPSTYLMVHKLSGVMHVSASELAFACGRRITSSFVGWSSNSFEMVDTNICAQCKAKAALHFGENSSEQYEPSSDDLSD